MIIRLKLFSKEKENEKKDGNHLKKAAAYGLGGSAALLAANTAAGYDLLMSKRSRENGTENSKKVYDALLKNSDGVDVRSAKDLSVTGNSPYYAGVDRKDADKFKKGITKKLRKRGYSNETINDFMDRTGLKNIGDDAVVLSENITKRKNATDAAILAHELGHSKYSPVDGYRKKRVADKGGKLGTIVHKIDGKIPALLKSPGTQTVGSFIGGVVSGKRGAKQKDETGKESTINKAAPYAVPGAINANLLAREGAASIKGLKLLKKYGADKATMSKARRALGTAGLTYATVSAIPLVAAKAGREVGKHLYEKEKKENDSKKKKN